MKVIRGFYLYFEEALVVLLMLSTVVVITLQVYCRYILNNPLIWTEEIARLLLVWTTFLGASIGIKRRSHILVDVAVSLLPEKMRYWVAILVDIVILFFLLILLPQGIRLAKITHSLPSAALYFPMSLFFSAVPVSTTFMIIHIIRQLFIRLVESTK